MFPAATRNHSQRKPIKKWITKRSLFAVSFLACLALAIFGANRSVKSKGIAVTVHAAGRGQGLLNPQDGQQMNVEYRGERSLVDAMRTGQASPRSLATTDLDSDGAPDVIAGYNYNGAGIVTVQRGNPDAFAPKDEAVFARIQQGYNPDSLLPTAETYQISEPADFLQLGDFNHDNQKDVLVAANGGQLFLLPGNGLGGFGTPELIPLSGTVTAMTSGEFRAADGLTDVAVAVNGPSGPELLIFDGAKGIADEPMRFPLRAVGSAIEFGEMDSDPFIDAAVLSGNEIEIVHGWGRKQTANLQSRVERVDLDFTARGLAIGYFIWNRNGDEQVAALGEDGTVHIFQRGQLNAQPFSEKEQAARAHRRLTQTRTDVDVETIPGWQQSNAEAWTSAREFVTGNVVGANATSQSLLQRSHVSFYGTDDLVVLGANQHKVDIVRQLDSGNGVRAEALTPAGDLTKVSMDTVDTPANVVALPQKLNGERNLVLLQAQSILPTLIPLSAAAVITVDRTDDTAAASACTAVANDCSLRGAVQFANANAGSTINIPAGTYTLTINGAGGCVTEASGNAVGDLEINTSTTLTGAGAATTIIRQTGTGNGTTFPGDRVMCLNVPFTVGLAYNFSGITITGGRDISSNNISNFGGAGIIGGEKNNTLALTSVVVSNNQSTGAVLTGGGIQITGGSVTVTNSTIGGTNNPGVNRSDATLGNSVGTSGGGIGYSPGSPTNLQPSTGTLTITGSTITHNTAASLSAGGGGADLFTHNLGTGSVSISTSTFSNNQATGTASGGGIIVESIATTVATTNLTSNSAGNRGGAIYVAGGSLLLDGTNPSITFSGNTATTAGSSISAASAVNVAGTNVTIGGDLEVTTNGVWTNNAGSSISPTNLIVAGGTFTANNSTTNVGGNFVFSSGTFNSNTGTFNFNGGIAQNITGPASPTFNNLIVNKSGGTTLTLGVNSPIVGNLTVTSGTLDLGAFTANRTVAGGTLTVSNGTLLKIGGTNTLPSNFSTHSVGATSTIEYSGTNQNVATLNSAQNYGNLTTSGSGTKTLLGAINITNTLTIGSGTTLDASVSNFAINASGNWTNNGTFTPRAGTVTFNGSGNAQSISGAASQAFNNIIINKSSGTTSVGASTTTLTLNGSMTLTSGVFSAGTAVTINVAGNWTNNIAAASFLPVSSTVIFTSTTAGQSINGTAASQTFNNLTVNKTGQTLNTGGSTTQLDLSGAFNLAAGTFTAPATLNVGGDWTEAVGTTFTPGTGLVTFNGSGAQNLNGTAAAQTFNNFQVNKSGGALTVGGSTVTLNLNGMTLVAGTFAAGTAATINLNGDWTNNGGVFTPGASTVSFNNTAAAQAINGTIASQTFNSINMAKTAQTLSVGGNTATLALNGSMTLASGTFAAGTAPAISVGGNWTNNGGTFTPGTGTVTFNGSAAQNLNGTAATQSFNNFGVNKASGTLTGVTLTTLNVNDLSIAAGTFAAGSITNLNVAGNWANAGTFTGGGSTVTFTGTTKTLSGSTTFNNLTINSAGGVSASGSTLVVTGLLRVQGGTLTSSSQFNNVQIDLGTTLAGTNSATMSVSGNWANSGTFTANNNIVNFNGNNNTQTVTGSTTFDNLIINHTGTGGVVLAASTSATVNTLLTLTSGTITTAASPSAVIVAAAGTVSRTSGFVIGGLKKFGLTSGSFTFDVGDANGYTPFALSSISGGGDLLVRTLTPEAPGLTAGTALKEYWDVTQTAAVSANLVYTYQQADVAPSNEAIYRIIRVTGATVATFNNACPSAPCVDTVNNTATINGVTQFGIGGTSSWTVGQTIPTAANGVVGGRIVDSNGAPVAGAVVLMSGTQNRKTITDSDGNYSFNNVETNGFYTVTPSRANYSFSPATRTFNQLAEKTDAVFTAASAGDSVNPLDTAEYFIRQQYVDLLGREPDEGGFNYWSDQILGCGSDAICTSARRRDVAAAFFIEAEFQQTGSFIYDLYKGALGRQPAYAEFALDHQGVVAGSNLDAEKQSLAVSFVQRAEFVQKYQTSNSADAFVDSMLTTIQQSAGVDLSARRLELIDKYNSQTVLSDSRGAVVRAIGDDPTLRQAEYNRAFVLTEYFSYLRRDPDTGGYAFWLNVLNSTDTGNFRGMVCAFITSAEYQKRFSSVVSRTDHECGQ